MPTLYLAGPMTGYENLNRPAFDRAAAALEGVGVTVLNPARQPEDRPREECLELALTEIEHADGVVTLAGWASSEGARRQVEYATAMDKPVGTLMSWLEEAAA